MQMAFGFIRFDGTVVSGSGNFSVEMTGAGEYLITIEGTGSMPVAVASALDIDPAFAVIRGTGRSGQGQPQFTVVTGFIDKADSRQRGVEGFTFVAYWNEVPG